jgi:ribosomal protein S18 acetylase RimI-like enzyme
MLVYIISTGERKFLTEPLILMPMRHEISYKIANTSAEFEQGKQLFKEYVASLGVDLSFQDVEKEFQTIQQQYNQPAGALLLAYMGAVAIGCAGIRKIDDTTAELKRMYVQDAYRGYGVGVQLLERSIQMAAALGYKKIRLDTLQNMTKAQALYRSFGFYEIPSYRFNPLEGAIYMEKAL